MSDKKTYKELAQKIVDRKNQPPKKAPIEKKNQKFLKKKVAEERLREIREGLNEG